MATSQKKPQQKSTQSRSRAKSRARTKDQTPIRREFGGIICFLLGVFSIFGYFSIDAIFINFFSSFLKGLLGVGFWFCAPVLFLASFVLTFHGGRAITARLLCTLSIPLTLSSIGHVFFPVESRLSFLNVVGLWKQGLALEGSGVLGSWIGAGFSAIFSGGGAVIIFVIFLLFSVLIAIDRNVSDLVFWFQTRPKYQEKPKASQRERKKSETAPRREYKEPAATPRRVAKERTEQYDSEKPVKANQTPKQTEPAKEDKRFSFFNKKSKVPPPDQFFSDETEQHLNQTPPPPMEEHAPPERELFTPPVEVLMNPIIPEPPEVEIVSPILPVENIPPVSFAPPEKQLELPETTQELETITPVAEPQQPQSTTTPSVTTPPTQNHSGSEYKYPPISLLSEGGGVAGGDELAELSANRKRLEDTIGSFNIDAKIVDVTRGPSVTRYEVELDQGVRLNKLTNLSDDIALALGATGVRIAPIPDKISMVGIEVPNKLVSPVHIRAVIGSQSFSNSPSKVSFAVGKDISGEAIVGNIAKLPHLLVAGTTGSGKSVCTNSLIISLLYKASPAEVRLIMVDPKMVELGIYNGIPHLLIPVVTDPKKAAGALQWAVTEMMKRYRLFSEVGARDLNTYNQYADRTDGVERMPQIVVVIDELADLMLVAAKEVEESICRVAQMGRASGMHLIIATQRPSADVITGLMKANIPSRIAFAVASSLESRIILDTQGAEKLVGRGDMLYAPLGEGKPTRVQGCLISDPEVAAVVEFVKRESGTASYSDEIMHEIEQNVAAKEKGNKGGNQVNPNVSEGFVRDEMLDQAVTLVLDLNQASASMLQRRLKLGYARAARLVDQMEELGYVAAPVGSKPREILITKEKWQEIQYRRSGEGKDAPSAPDNDAPWGEDEEI